MRTWVDGGLAKNAMLTSVWRILCAPCPPPTNMASQRKPPSRLRFITDLSQCLLDFVIQLLPPPDELRIKEDVRALLQRLIRTIEPDSRLLAFGSTANGFSLRNSGVCVFVFVGLYLLMFL
jgi:hypothetical protein